MRRKELWKQIFRHQQKSGWCGPAVVQMALASGGIRKTQKSISHDIYQPWWGTTQQAMLAYLSRFFKLVKYKENSTVSDLEKHLEKGDVIIVNWWDDIDPQDTADGHYCLVLDYDKERKKLTLADPSEGRGIWKIDKNEFNSKWYDYLDLHSKTWLNGWMLWLDPKSRIKE